MSSAVTIYHNPQCGTSRNVLALIRNAGIEPEVIEYLKTPPTREALQELVANSGSQFDPGVVQALLAVVSHHGEGWVAAPPRRQKPAIEPWSGRIRYRSS